jgi:hypothetical protein
MATRDNVRLEKCLAESAWLDEKSAIAIRFAARAAPETRCGPRMDAHGLERAAHSGALALRSEAFGFQKNHFGEASKRSSM